MTKVTSVRKAVQSDNTATSTNEKAQHYMNIYLGDVQIGYAVLDKQPDIVSKAQKDPEFLNRLLKHESTTANYRQAGVSNKPKLDLDDI